MKNETLQNSLRFIGLLLLQVLVLNHLNLFGFVNPLVYIVWVFLYPIKKNRIPFLLLSFLLGLCVDIFSNAGGINAAATLFIAYIRLPLLKIITQKPEIDFYFFKLTSISFYKIFLFFAISIFAHHFVIFSLECFSFNALKTIVYNTFLTSIFTLIISILGIVLFVNRK